ncbi:MAG: hypothetical protein U0270_27815 [Labilithrix sp.]
MGTLRNARPEQLALLDAGGEVIPEVKRAKAAKGPRKAKRGCRLGRRPRLERLGFVPHDARDPHDHRHPVHVSMRRVRLAPSLRTERIFAVILAQLAYVKRQGVRVVHHSVQRDHVHLIVEGRDRRELSDHMRRLFSRIARAVNSVAGRSGSLFRDRHHRHELKGPTETRNALVYVLFNERKHHAQNGGAFSESTLDELDDRSSVAFLQPDDWAEDARPPPELLAQLRRRASDLTGGELPVSAPGTWLARQGWRVRGGGPMSLHELPRFL